MVGVLKPDFQENLVALGRLSMDFWSRMMLLTAKGVDGIAPRLQRVHDKCAPAARQLLSAPLAMSEQGVELLTECQGACLEEVRNTEQVAMINCEEMKSWGQSFADHWQRLALSAY